MKAVSTGEALRLTGHLDGRCSAEVRGALYEYIHSHSEEDVIVDLSEVESIDVTFLRLLATAAVRVERGGHRLILRGCSPGLRRVMARSGWRRLFCLERERKE